MGWMGVLGVVKDLKVVLALVLVLSRAFGSSGIVRLLASLGSVTSLPRAFWSEWSELTIKSQPCAERVAIRVGESHHVCFSLRYQLFNDFWSDLRPFDFLVYLESARVVFGRVVASVPPFFFDDISLSADWAYTDDVSVKFFHV